MLQILGVHFHNYFWAFDASRFSRIFGLGETHCAWAELIVIS